MLSWHELRCIFATAHFDSPFGCQGTRRMLFEVPSREVAALRLERQEDAGKNE